MRRQILLIPISIALALGHQASALPVLHGLANPSAPSASASEEGDFAGENLALLFWCTSAVANANISEAQKACGQAIEFNPENPAPYKLRGMTYLMDMRYEDARIDFAEAIALAPGDVESQSGYAESLSGEGHYQAAITGFSIAIQLAPNDPRPWTARCWTRGLFARELRAGLSDCNEALRLAPFDTNALESRGLIYLRIGKLGDAVRDFNIALDKAPDLATARYGRGAIRFRSDDWTSARRDIVCARVENSNVDAAFSQRPLIPPHLFSAAHTQRVNCGRQMESTESRGSSS